MYRKGLLGNQKEWIMEYESSMEEDKEICQEVIDILKVHIEHLNEQGYVNKDTAENILKALDELKRDPTPIFKEEAEDIHEAIEIQLEKRIGEEANWISLGRSRNDHVAAAIRLHLKKEIKNIITQIKELRITLLKKASEHTESIMPGFTHLQCAQPITYAHYLL